MIQLEGIDCLFGLEYNMSDVFWQVLFYILLTAERIRGIHLLVRTLIGRTNKAGDPAEL